MKAERITWLDSNTHDGWHDPSLQEYKPITCTTVGFVVDEGDAHVSLAASYESAEQVAQVMTIPKAIIQERVSLNEEQ